MFPYVLFKLFFRYLLLQCGSFCMLVARCGELFQRRKKISKGSFKSTILLPVHFQSGSFIHLRFFVSFMPFFFYITLAREGARHFESPSPTFNFQLSTINLQPSTFNLQLSTINHQPSTFNHQPSTFNLQPFIIFVVRFYTEATFSH